jgi:hypothetical protein
VYVSDKFICARGLDGFPYCWDNETPTTSEPELVQINGVNKTIKSLSLSPEIETLYVVDTDGNAWMKGMRSKQPFSSPFEKSPFCWNEGAGNCSMLAIGTNLTSYNMGCFTLLYEGSYYLDCAEFDPGFSFSRIQNPSDHMVIDFKKEEPVEILEQETDKPCALMKSGKVFCSPMRNLGVLVNLSS